MPPLIYSILGSSRHLAVGPVSIASLVMGSMITEAVSYNEHPTLYLKLAFTATFFAGVFQASLGLLRYKIKHKYNQLGRNEFPLIFSVYGFVLQLMVF